MVHRNGDGSYRIKELDKGTFVTNAGGAAASPGNCPANHSRHGHTVLPGKVGTLKGYLKGTVTGGTFDPNGACAATPCTQAMFIAAFFGPAATFSCRTNSTDCKFKYDYHAKKNQGLLFRHWQDRGHGAGTLLAERFKGDIASA
jgi:hypothetical protein